jgi:hypothetical protein
VQDSIQAVPGPLKLTSAFATAKFSQTKFTLLPGRSTTVAVTFTPPSGTTLKTFSVYSGFIDVVGSLGEAVHSSYLGVVGSLKDLQVIDNTDFLLGECRDSRIFSLN